MSVHRRNDVSSWQVKWRVNGDKKSKNFSDKKYGGRLEAKAQAEAFDVQIKADVLRGEYIDPHRNKISLSDFKHEVGLTKASHKESSMRALEDTWESRVAPYPIADMSIGSINPNVIAMHLRDLRKENGDLYSRSALDKTLEVIRVLLQQAYEMDLIKKNPAKTNMAKKYLPKARKPDHIYLTIFQVNAIEKEIAKSYPQYSNVIPLLAFTGLRSGELRALTWDDIDFDNATLSVNKSIDDDNNMKINYDDAKTEKSVRTIALDSITLSRLKQQQKEYSKPDCQYIFPDRDCSSPIRARNFKRRILKPALEKLDLDSAIALHTFRHTSVYLAVLGGADILSISKRLGHASINITADTYSDLFKETDVKVVQGLEKLQKSIDPPPVDRNEVVG